MKADQPEPCSRIQLIFPPHEHEEDYGKYSQNSSAVLVRAASHCDAVSKLANVPIGLEIDCMEGPEEVSASNRQPTEMLISQYKAILKQGIPKSAEFLYLRGIQTFASLRCAVLAVTDVTGRPIMAEVEVGQDGILTFGTDIIAAVGVLQSIGVTTIIISGENVQDVSHALQMCAPYARISLGVKVEPSWLNQSEYPLDGAEIYLPRYESDTEEIGNILRTYDVKSVDYREHDDMILAPDGTNAHFLDSCVDISDEIEVGSRFSERLIEAEDESGALKLVFETEDDLECFEEEVFMLARPVCLCAEQVELLESALRIYPGRALYDGTWELEEHMIKYFSEKYGMIRL